MGDQLLACLGGGEIKYTSRFLNEGARMQSQLYSK
jgi:hypothetical protein